QDEMCAERRIDMGGEGLHHAGHVLHAVPARRLQDKWRIGRRRRPELHDVRAASDTPTRTVAAGERYNRWIARTLHESGVAECEADVPVRHRLVLRRERVDRRGDDERLRGVGPRRREGRTGEKEATDAPGGG